MIEEYSTIGDNTLLCPNTQCKVVRKHGKQDKRNTITQDIRWLDILTQLPAEIIFDSHGS